jgi:hypothetical protein
MEILQNPVTFMAILFAVVVGIASWKMGRKAPVASRPPATSGWPPPLCSHLLPVEAAMRAQGIRFLDRGGPTQANCRIDDVKFRARFPAPLSYREMYQPERHPFDNPRAEIFCNVCGQFYGILVVHPDQYGGPNDSGVVFPAAE